MRPPIAPRPLGRLAALAAGAALLAACSSGGGDVSDLREDLEVQAQAQASLRERIQELEGMLVSNDEDGTATSELLGGLEEQLQGFTEELAQLRLDLDAATTAAEDRAAQVDASVTSLDGRIVELEDRITSLEALIQQVRNSLLSLTDEHELLRAEFEDHTSNHG